MLRVEQNAEYPSHNTVVVALKVINSPPYFLMVRLVDRLSVLTE